MLQYNETIQNYRFTNDGGTDSLRNYVRDRVINGNESEESRIAAYELNWQFYLGNHWRKYSPTMTVFNYTRAFVDKVPQFLVGNKPFTFCVSSYSSDTVDEKTEDLAEKLFLYHWNKNSMLTFTYKAMQMGGVTGDCFLSLNWDSLRKCVKLNVLDSRQCFPQIDPFDLRNFTSFIIRAPVGANPDKYVIKVSQYLNDKIVSWYQKDTNISIKDSEKYELSDIENPLGFIPIIHIQNKANSAGYYGLSDTNDVVKLNKTFNEMAQKLNTIINYHVEPTTIVTGATVTDLNKRAGNIWSGFPSEANIFNLGLDADLSALTDYMEVLKKAMHELTDVPENFMGKLQSVSHTSAAAIQLTYQPIVQQADLKGLQYGEGFSRVNEMIVKFIRIYDSGNVTLSTLDKISESGEFENDFKATPIFKYGFPQDKVVELQIADTELRLKLNSRRRILNKLGNNNTTELLKEIDEDTVHLAELDGAYQKIVADIVGVSPQKQNNSSPKQTEGESDSNSEGGIDGKQKILSAIKKLLNSADFKVGGDDIVVPNDENNTNIDS